MKLSEIVACHMCACSTNVAATTDFGINPKNVFAFWDWVGGRYSVWSAIGILPLSIHFGFECMQDFLSGGQSIDQHFKTEGSIEKNIPLLLGLIGYYNTTILSLC